MGYYYCMSCVVPVCMKSPYLMLKLMDASALCQYTQHYPSSWSPGVSNSIIIYYWQATEYIQIRHQQGCSLYW